MNVIASSSQTSGTQLFFGVQKGLGFFRVGLQKVDVERFMFFFLAFRLSKRQPSQGSSRIEKITKGKLATDRQLARMLVL